jgi:hypothetical protein
MLNHAAQLEHHAQELRGLAERAPTSMPTLDEYEQLQKDLHVARHLGPDEEAEARVAVVVEPFNERFTNK